VKRHRLALIRDLGRMIRRHKTYFLVPFLTLLMLVMVLLVLLESPALMPFFYALF
jgi:hypothetical protein